MKHYVKAYTLLETVLSLVIMSVISIVVYALLSSFLNQFRFYTETKDNTLEYVLFRTNLKHEFYSSKEVIEEARGIKIKMNDSIEVRYEFDKSRILRKVNQTSIDTFFIKVKDHDVILANEKSKRYITKLSLDLIILEEPFRLNLKKEYGAHKLVNNDFGKWK